MALTILVREVLDLLKGEVVELHQLHAREGLNIEVSNTCGELSDE